MDFLQDYNQLIASAKEAMNVNHNYVKAYNDAIQAKLIAEKYLEDQEKTIESLLIQGIAYTEIDLMKGHDYLRDLYINKSDILDVNDRLNLKVKTALARAKRKIGEFDEAIALFEEIISYVRRKLKILKNNPPAGLKKGLLTCLIEMNSCQICNYRQNHSLSTLQKYEDDCFLNENDILNELKKIIEIDKTGSKEHLKSIENLANESLEFIKSNNLDSYEPAALLRKACVLMDKGEINTAKDIIQVLLDNEVIHENYYGHVLNELAMVNIYEKDLESAKENFNRAFYWLMIQKDEEEVVRNSYIQSLYYLIIENYDMAYACAGFGFNQNQDLCCLKILYLISKIKYLMAKKRNHETEYITYYYDHQKYTNMLKERVR